MGNRKAKQTTGIYRGQGKTVDRTDTQRGLEASQRAVDLSWVLEAGQEHSRKTNSRVQGNSVSEVTSKDPFTLNSYK